MSKIAPKCKIGFPCGGACINRQKKCFANLSTKDNRVAETFSQFVNRIVGIGNNNLKIDENTINKTILNNIEPVLDAVNNIEAGPEVAMVLEELSPIIKAGSEVFKLLNELQPVTTLVEKAAELKAGDELKPVINAGKDVTKILDELKPQIIAGPEATKLLEDLKPKIKAGEEVTKILDKLKPQIVAGPEAAKLLEDLLPQINAGPAVAKILEDLLPIIRAGADAAKILKELKPNIKASENLTKLLKSNEALDEYKAQTTKYAKSYDELTKGELKAIKAFKDDINKVMEILLTPEGQLNIEELNKEEKEIKDLEYKESSEKANKINQLYYKDTFVEGYSNFGPNDYKRIIRPYKDGEGNLSDLIVEKINPIKDLLKENIKLAEEYGSLDPVNPRHNEVKGLYKKNIEEIKKLLEIDQDYKDNLYNLVTLHNSIKELALENYPFNDKIYDIEISQISNKIKEAKMGVQSPEEWLKTDFNQEIALKMDNRMKEIEDEIESTTIPGLKEKRRDFNNRKENLKKELDRQISGKTGKENYNREGNISDNIKARNLPNGDSNNPEEQKLQELINERAPMMAMGVSAFKEIVNGDGEFKNVFDFDNKKGIAGRLTKEEFQKYKEARINKEYEALGVPREAPAENRPVYGFMGNQEDLAFQMSYEGVQAYGEIVIEFKPEVKDDITVTIDDSLGGPNPNQKGSPANKVSKESMPNRDKAIVNLEAKDFRDIIGGGSAGTYRKPRYIEWQSGGRLDISNVSKVYVPINILRTIPAKLLKQLEESGIEIVILSPRDQ